MDGWTSKATVPSIAVDDQSPASNGTAQDADNRQLPTAYRLPPTAYLVGAGPGDPDLITVKGLRCLRRADVVIYDRLIDPALLDEARPDATRIFVGKGAGYHTMPQEQINALLVAHARQGRVVVRLKGGDPFVFGRGGEEAAALAAAGIPFEVVPGVSAAIAVPAYAGIPVTHRGHGSLMTVVTAHECAPAAGVDWEALARVGGTLIIMMGVAALPHVTQRLRDGGLAPHTPAAVIEQGTTAQQRVVEGTLTDIAERAAAADIRPPAITVVGAVAALRASLAWFETASRQRPRDDRGARHIALDG
jgi:uroporphyrin-III C-methyltransferase